MMLDPVSLTQRLLEFPSISPDDKGCQLFIADFFKKLGFTIRHMPYGSVQNLFARFGNTSPLLIFVGHTDVVPIIDDNAWKYPPFSGTVADGFLHGRGVTDMKGGIGAMMAACSRFLKQHPSFKGSIAFLLTSDEETEAIDGTQKVVQQLQKEQIEADWTLVGEPTCKAYFGDQIKIGRRGSLSVSLTIFGEAKHVAYAHSEDNPTYQLNQFLQTLFNTPWDEGLENNVQTTLQITQLSAKSAAENITPQEAHARFNFRFHPDLTHALLEEKIKTLALHIPLPYTLQFQEYAHPYHSKSSHLAEVCRNAIHDTLGVESSLQMSGGTSDGRFMSAICDDIIEFGLNNLTLHQINEHVAIDELVQLSRVYERMLEMLFIH